MGIVKRLGEHTELSTIERDSTAHSWFARAWWQAPPALEAFVKQLPANSLSGMRVAAFDTRFEAEEQGVGLRLLMSVLRYAADRLAKDVVKKGGRLVAEPEGFIVENKEGPLKQGELERASTWAKGMHV